MEVEITVQDCYFEESGSPVAPETWEIWFRHWMNALNPDFSPIQSYDLSLRLTTDAEIQALNAQYRQVDRPTDVLAFSSLEIDSPESAEMRSTLPLYLGDIVISMDTARRQADQEGHAVTQELAWLATHGLLHLLGWDHPDPEALNRMLQQQEALLQKVGLTIRSGYAPNLDH